jgi:hypothetical protein
VKKDGEEGRRGRKEGKEGEKGRKAYPRVAQLTAKWTSPSRAGRMAMIIFWKIRWPCDCAALGLFVVSFIV